MTMIRINLTAALCAATMTAFAAAPDGYYDKCLNKNGAALLQALYNTVGTHTNVSYDGLWTVYQTSDVRDDGTVWDMYSTKHWVVGKDHCGNYKNVGDCINREHSFPKSWFNDASPMVSDAFHVYPTDGKVNGQRSNLPYGECASGTSLGTYNGVTALGRMGSSTFAGYTGKVFEPDDEYKGDFARSYFYMAAAYNNRIASWSSDMLAGNAYPAFSTWALNLLLKWHRQDPVSDKERARNDAVYAAQNNRNPFIDRPELAEYVWGDRSNEPWTYAAGQQPAFITPADGTTLDLGTASTAKARSITVTVKSQLLTQGVTLATAGTGFAVAPATLTAAQCNAGAQVTLTFACQTPGQYAGTLTLQSGTAHATVNLSARAMQGLPATEATHVTHNSFVAHWTYIGNEDQYGCYLLHVTDADGNVIDTYPRRVKATDEQCLVDELEQETHYIYKIQAGDLHSNTMHVTTGTPQPSVQFMTPGGDLHLTAQPGQPSDPAEVLADIDNIGTDILVTVKPPFQISNDRDNWATSLSLSPDEDRFYIRVFSDEAGDFETTLTATAGDYFTDEATATATVTAQTSFHEDFEAHANGNYTQAQVQGTAAKWNLTNAGVYALQNEAANGTNYLRMGTSSSSAIETAQDKPRGIGTVTMMVSGWSAKDGAYEFDLQTSSDGGQTWQTAAHTACPAPASSTKAYTLYTYTVNRPGNLRLRVAQTYGARFCIDDIKATDYTSAIDGVTSDINAWDARCLDGRLVIELDNGADVFVCGTDGIVRHNGPMPAGTNTLDLGRGLYIVTVADFARRVLVR